MAPEIFQESVQQSQMPAMDMWAAGVLLHLVSSATSETFGETVLALPEHRYLLFTGDCPVQQEDMPKLQRKDPESQDIVLKARAASGPAVVLVAAVSR